MSVDLDLGDTRLIMDVADQEGLTKPQTAYVLATAFWETNRTMKPVQEAYWLSEAWRQRNLRYYPWHGRGYVQLTWEANYERAEKELGIDLTNDPAVVMQPDIAARILVVGSRDGWFTGKKLSDYINDEKKDYRGARRIINGTDKAAQIEILAEHYEYALLAPERDPVKDLQRLLGVAVDGIWGKNSASALDVHRSKAKEIAALSAQLGK